MYLSFIHLFIYVALIHYNDTFSCDVLTEAPNLAETLRSARDKSTQVVRELPWRRLPGFGLTKLFFFWICGRTRQVIADYNHYNTASRSKGNTGSLDRTAQHLRAPQQHLTAPINASKSITGNALSADARGHNSIEPRSIDEAISMVGGSLFHTPFGHEHNAHSSKLLSGYRARVHLGRVHCSRSTLCWQHLDLWRENFHCWGSLRVHQLLAQSIAEIERCRHLLLHHFLLWKWGLQRECYWSCHSCKVP